MSCSCPRRDLLVTNRKLLFGSLRAHSQNFVYTKDALNDPPILKEKTVPDEIFRIPQVLDSDASTRPVTANKATELSARASEVESAKNDSMARLRQGLN